MKCEYNHQVIHVEISDLYKKEFVLLWAILSFKAGLINACGFLFAGTYVSHVTGFGTQVGLALGHEEFRFSMELLIIPITFTGGALIVSMVLDRDFSLNRAPHYHWVQSFITFLLGLIVCLFEVGVFRVQDLMIHSEESIFFIGLLCLICGLKNGLTTWATYGRIRTTHLTGLATDIGLHLPKSFMPKNTSFRYPESRKVNYVRIVTACSFSLGSCIAVMLIPKIGYKVFYVAFAISILLWWVSMTHRNKLVRATSVKAVLNAR